jgi:hypothetical protein
VHRYIKASSISVPDQDTVWQRFTKATHKLPLVPEDQLQSIQVTHRYTGVPALPCKHLIKVRDWRFQLGPVKRRYQRGIQKNYAFGSFGLSETVAIEFEVAFHRPFRRVCLVKQISWVGKATGDTVNPWAWSLQILVREEPHTKERRTHA